MKRADLVVDRFLEGFSCAQALLSVYGEGAGLERDTALRVAGALGGGMAQTGGTCGAVTGGLLVIGLAHGKVRPDDAAAKELTYGLAQEFMDLFKKRNGTLVCRELLGCDVSTPEGRTLVADQKLYTTRCPRFVIDAAEILEDLLRR
ncbi:MAG: C-GCAxxG-C-C family protein [Nitrospiraceae bacterium]|nr:C-GCAxxG-C-C family protein [Nitrospiraceae bacterium]